MCRPWKLITIEAENSFQYMLQHNLTPYDDHIDHFKVYSANSYVTPYYDEIQDAYGADIERLIIPWIREEERSGRLKNRNLWQPFRDDQFEEDAIMGYRHMFVYYPTKRPIRLPYIRRASFGPEEVPCVDGSIPRLTRIYFMLSLASSCTHYPNQCSICLSTRSCIPNYVAALYGWEEDDMPYFKPYVHFGSLEPVGSEIPAVFWDRPDDP
jgi:hypothetical protein